MIQYIVNILKWTSNNRWFSAVRKGLLQMQGIVIVGCISILFNNVILPYIEILLGFTLNQEFKNIWMHIHQGTLAVMAIMTVASISYILVDSNKAKYEFKVDPLIGSLVSLASYFILVLNIGEAIPIKVLGVEGVFASIIISLIATELYLYICKKRNLNIKVISEDADLRLEQSMLAIIPIISILTIFATIRFMLEQMSIGGVHELLNDMIKLPMSNSHTTLIGNITYQFATNLLWFLGLHGSNILGAVNNEAGIINLQENMALLQNGQEATNIFTTTFNDVFVSIGGSGATLCLVLAILLLRSKGSSNKLAKIGLLTGVFNINEPIVYGLPIMLNPIFMLPFIMIPVIYAVTAYLAMSSGIVPLPNAEVSWTAPVIINGYLATGSVAGSILQIVNLTIGTIIYIPFVKAYEKYTMEESKEIYNKLKNHIFCEEGAREKLIGRSDEIGTMARSILRDFRNDLKDGKIELHYQPQMSNENKIIGVEALLRWKHNAYGWVAPPVPVTLIEESDASLELNKWIFDEALGQLSKWKEKGIEDMVMSINVSPLQFTDERFVGMIEEILQKYNVSPKELKLEITENMSLGNDEVTKKQIKRIHELGISFAIDDFGMGHSSLLYLQRMKIDTIKIDGSLIKNIINDKNSQDIVNSICYLAKSAKIDMIAEFVETEEQKEFLNSIGVSNYQGYLYSQALNKDECEKYIFEV